jgi:hypothetical protein
VSDTEFLITCEGHEESGREAMGCGLVTSYPLVNCRDLLASNLVFL